MHISDQRHCRLLRVRGERPRRRQSSNSRDEIASSHRLPRKAQDHANRAVQPREQSRKFGQTEWGKQPICAMSPIGQKQTYAVHKVMFALPPGPTICRRYFEQSRGVIFFSAAYLADTSSTIGPVTVSSAVYQPEMTFHALPSHCCIRADLAPSWSAQVTCTGSTMPSKPSSLSRASLRRRCSSPHWTCSPVKGFLPKFSCALRIPSTPIQSVRCWKSPVRSPLVFPCLCLWHRCNAQRRDALEICQRRTAMPRLCIR